jgi:hypothetical protein
MKTIAKITGGLFWCSLGFYRGMTLYAYEQYKYGKERPYMYSLLVYNGCIGVFVYANPLFLIITVPKEIYRLEVNIRSLEVEKKKDYFYRLF